MFNTVNQQTKGVIESAREAREKRALDKRKETSILKIQALVRGFILRQRILKQWLKELDEVIGFTCDKKSSNLYNAISKHKQITKVDNKTLGVEQTIDWKYATFSSNTLVGAFGNLAQNKAENKSNISDQNVTKQKAIKSKQERIKTDEEKSVPIKMKKVLAVDLFDNIRRFIFIFNIKRDKKRHLKLCQYLLKNVLSESLPKFSYAQLCLHKKKALLWIMQVKAVLEKCLCFFNKLNQNLLPIIAQLCNSILHDLLQKEFFVHLGKLLTAKSSLYQPSSFTSSVIISFDICIRILSSVKMKNEHVLEFARNMLSVPGFIWHIKKNKKSVELCKTHLLLLNLLSLLKTEGQCRKFGLLYNRSKNEVTEVLCTVANLAQLAVIDIPTLEKHSTEFVSVMNQFFDFLNELMAQQSSSMTTWHPVVGFCNSRENSCMPAMGIVREQVTCLWNPSLLRCIFHDVLSLESLHKDDEMPSQAEQITTRTAPKSKLSDKVNSYLKKFAKPRNAMRQTGGRNLNYKDVINTMSACIMYKMCLAVVTKQLRLEMLTGLTFMEQILTRLWRFICELGPTGGLNLFLDALKKPDAAQPYFAVFTLFCDMSAHILSILDDVEFYDQQIPFHLEELVTVSSYLRTFVFRIIWDGMAEDRRSKLFDVFTSAHTLLLMLYDRDARRPFTPTNHWLCRDVKPSTVRSEFEKGSTRSHRIIDKIPFILPHKERVLLFRSLVSAEKSQYEDSDAVHITIHRSRIVEDGFHHLSSIRPEALKGTVRIKFINDLGLDEAGIDQDGVFKEFLEETITRVFNPDMNLFRVTPNDNKLYPSSTSYIQDNHLSLFRFVGLMLGKAIYDGIVVDVPFAIFFLRHLQNQQHNILYSPIDELPSLDPEFYKNLTWIKRYEGDISDLDLTFTHEEDILGNIVSRELIPGGTGIPVTNDNKIMYIHMLAHYRLHTLIRDQTKAFITGFRSIIRKEWTAMFSAPELQRLISGDNVDIDLNDLKMNVMYYGGFHSSHRVIRWLWDILDKEYDPSQRGAFLKFVTSCSRPPLLGFNNLQPQFSIRCVEVSDEEDTGDTVGTVLRGFFRISSKSTNSSGKHRLPTASTCFNLLKLPNYPSKQVLRDKLKQAIANNTGFELS